MRRLKIRTKCGSKQEFLLRYESRLSKSSIMLPSKNPPGVGMTIGFRLVLDDASTIFEGTGIVAQTSELPAGVGMKVTFSNLPQSSRDLINELFGNSTNSEVKSAVRRARQITLGEGSDQALADLIASDPDLAQFAAEEDGVPPRISRTESVMWEEASSPHQVFDVDDNVDVASAQSPGAKRAISVPTEPNQHERITVEAPVVDVPEALEAPVVSIPDALDGDDAFALSNELTKPESLEMHASIDESLGIMNQMSPPPAVDQPAEESGEDFDFSAIAESPLQGRLPTLEELETASDSELVDSGFSNLVRGTTEDEIESAVSESFEGIVDTVADPLSQGEALANAMAEGAEAAIVVDIGRQEHSVNSVPLQTDFSPEVQRQPAFEQESAFAPDIAVTSTEAFPAPQEERQMIAEEDAAAFSAQTGHWKQDAQPPHSDAFIEQDEALAAQTGHWTAEEVPATSDIPATITDYDDDLEEIAAEEIELSASSSSIQILDPSASSSDIQIVESSASSSEIQINLDDFSGDHFESAEESMDAIILDESDIEIEPG